MTLSHAGTLRKGRIENPDFEKLRALAKALGFPPEVEFEEDASCPLLRRMILVAKEATLPTQKADVRERRRP